MNFLGRAKSTLETLSTLLVVVAASGLIWTLFFRQQTQAAGPPPPLSDVKETLSAEVLTNVLGTGEIAIIEFSDFQCPFCAKHATETLPILKKELIESGKARYVALDLPLAIHPQAGLAAEIAECAAEQGKFWDMHTALFANQKTLGSGDYERYADDMGLNIQMFKACLDSDRMLEKVKADTALATRLGVNSTPTIFIGRMRTDGGVDLLRRVSGAQGAETFVAEVTKLAKR